MSYIRRGDLDENEYPPFKAVQEAFGFVPNFYKAQTLRPDLVESHISSDVKIATPLRMKNSALQTGQPSFASITSLPSI